MLSTLLILALSSLPAAQEPRVDSAEVVREADRAFFRETRARGLEGWLSCFSADAVVFPPAAPLALGSEALRRHYTSLGGFPAGDFLWEPEEAGLSAAGDFGWTRGRWGSDASGSPVWAGQYLSMWRKEADGAWKVVADCSYVPDYATKLAGLAGAPVTSGSESEASFRSLAGDLSASAGNWWTSDAQGNEIGGTFLSVWRRNPDGTEERLFSTGVVLPER
jgi:ketosteroid isomerase-like protein